MLSAYIHLCGNNGGSGPATVTIDYSRQLQDAVGLLTNLVTDIRAHETATGVRHDATIQKLESLNRVADSFLVLLQEGRASQEQIKALISQIADQVPGIKTAIEGLQSAALDALETLGNLMQREFDETQAALNNLTNAVNTGFSQREQTWHSERITVVALETSVTVTIPAGASDISAYIVGNCTPFIAGNKVFAVGEQYHRSNAASGNLWMVEPQTVFEVPAGTKFQASYRARRNLGAITQVGGGNWSISDMEQLIEIPDILEGSGY
jgi:hypothetical protein